MLLAGIKSLKASVSPIYIEPFTILVVHALSHVPEEASASGRAPTKAHEDINTVNTIIRDKSFLILFICFPSFYIKVNIYKLIINKI